MPSSSYLIVSELILISHIQTNSTTDLYTYFYICTRYEDDETEMNFIEMMNDKSTRTQWNKFTHAHHTLLTFNWHYTITSLPLKYVNGKKTSLCVYDNKKKSNKDS